MSRKEATSPSTPSLPELILGYLRRHPQAKDTIEGITEWWLLEERIVRAELAIQAALDELVADGWVLRESQFDGRVFYRANPAKIASP
jgi:hypothetical protein